MWKTKRFAARANGHFIGKLYRAYDKSFKQNLKDLNVLAPDHYPYATKYINEIIELTKILLKKNWRIKAKTSPYILIFQKFKNTETIATENQNNQGRRTRSAGRIRQRTSV